MEINLRSLVGSIRDLNGHSYDTRWLKMFDEYLFYTSTNIVYIEATFSLNRMYVGKDPFNGKFNLSIEKTFFGEKGIPIDLKNLILEITKEYELHKKQVLTTYKYVIDYEATLYFSSHPNHIYQPHLTINRKFLGK